MPFGFPFYVYIDDEWPWAVAGDLGCPSPSPLSLLCCLFAFSYIYMDAQWSWVVAVDFGCPYASPCCATFSFWCLFAFFYICIDNELFIVIPSDHIYIYNTEPKHICLFFWVTWPWEVAMTLVFTLLLSSPSLVAVVYWFLCAFFYVFMDDELLIWFPSEHIYMYIHVPDICICVFWGPWLCMMTDDFGCPSPSPYCRCGALLMPFFPSCMFKWVMSYLQWSHLIICTFVYICQTYVHVFWVTWPWVADGDFGCPFPSPYCCCVVHLMPFWLLLCMSG